MKIWMRLAAMIGILALLAACLGCAGANSPGSKQAQIMKRMQTSHRNK
jgi:cytochrome c556